MCPCGRPIAENKSSCGPCAAIQHYYNQCSDIFNRERFPNQFEIVQQLMRWPWTLYNALDVWAKSQDTAEKAERGGEAHNPHGAP